MRIASQNFKQMLLASNNDVKLVVRSKHDLENINDNTVEIRIEDDCCNDISELKISGCKKLMKLEVGNNACQNVDTVIIEDCNILQRISIDKDSFTSIPNWRELKDDDVERLNKPERSLTIRNCLMLEKIIIGEGSFVDYAGSFSLTSILV